MSKGTAFPRINLIPKAQQASLLAMPSFAVPAIVGITVLVVSTMAVRQHFQLKGLRQERAEIAKKSQETTDRIAALRQQQLLMEKKKKQASVIQQILAKKISWSDFFKEMSMMIPKSIWLNEMKAGINKDGKREIIIQGTGESPQIISAFFQGLEQSYFFQKIMIVSSTLDTKVHPPLYRFKFKCPLEDLSDAALTGEKKQEPEVDAIAPAKPSPGRSPRRAGKPADAGGASG